jgi:Uma2 family endonuclease
VTSTSVRYRTYLEYLEAELGEDGSFRLLSSGEVIQLPPEDESNTFIADELAYALKQVVTNRRLVKTYSTELQVHPVGDRRMSRAPDVMVLQPDSLEQMAGLKKGAILFEMPAPVFVAEVVSPGGEGSDNYRRDYEWKRQQYEWWKIPEYWIIDRHRKIVSVLVLNKGIYEERVYRESDRISSSVFPALNVSLQQLLAGGAI